MKISTFLVDERKLKSREREYITAVCVPAFLCSLQVTLQVYIDTIVFMRPLIIKVLRALKAYQKDKFS